MRLEKLDNCISLSPFAPVSRPRGSPNVFQPTCAPVGSGRDTRRAYPLLWPSVECPLWALSCCISHIFPLALTRLGCYCVRLFGAPSTPLSSTIPPQELRGLLMGMGGSWSTCIRAIAQMLESLSAIFDPCHKVHLLLNKYLRKGEDSMCVRLCVLHLLLCAQTIRAHLIDGPQFIFVFSTAQSYPGALVYTQGFTIFQSFPLP